MELNDKLISALGSITVSFSTLELFISYFVWGLIGPDPKLGKIITSQMSFSRLLDLLSSLFKYRVHDDKKIETLKGLVQEAVAAVEKRNKYVHSFWWTESGKITRSKITAKGFNQQIQDISVAELNKTADSITHVANKFLKFMGPILSSLSECDEEDIIKEAERIQKALSSKQARRRSLNMSDG